MAGKKRPCRVLEVNTRAVRRFTEDEVSFVWSMASVLATSDLMLRDPGLSLDRLRMSFTTSTDMTIESRERGAGRAEGARPQEEERVVG